MQFQVRHQQQGHEGRRGSSYRPALEVDVSGAETTPAAGATTATTYAAFSGLAVP